MRPLLLLSICLLATAVPHVQARCPFAHLFEGEALEAPHDAGAGRELLQQRPRPGGQQPPQQQPPQQPPPPAAPCNIAALSAAAPFTPAGPASQGAVDLRVKQVAISVITAPATATPPGVGTAAAPNTGIPLGAFLRLAFHDVGTFNRSTNTGGANGSVRLELAGASRGMVDAAAQCDRWRTAINARLAADPQVPAGTLISYADVYQLAGAAVVEATQGPALLASVPVGRVDAPPAGATSSLDNVAGLPAATLDFGPLACLFLQNGYTLTELVALSGAHTIGVRAPPPGTGPAPVPLTPTPTVFNTDYFSGVLAGTAAFRTDNVLGQNAVTRLLVQQYAGSQTAFHSAFASAFLKMGKMGATWRSYGATLRSKP